MLNDLLKAIRQLDDPAVRGVIIRSVLLAIATFVLLLTAIGALLPYLQATGVAWLDTTLQVAGFGIALIATWLLFPVIIAAFTGLFIDQIAAAVERRHYPRLPPPAGAGIAEQVFGTVRFTVMAVLLNLVVLPLYLIPGANVVIFLVLNGYLLGREYFETAALRRLNAGPVREMRRAARGELSLGGALIAVMSTIPLVNLLAPVIGCAFMVHRFQRLHGEHESIARAASDRRTGAELQR